MDLVQELRAACIAGVCPPSDRFFELFTDESGLFLHAEGGLWDFKDEWPFSYSDEYFGGIARLICAFANTSGGMIIFGVHDKKRTGGHNKVRLNMDKLHLAMRQLTGQAIPLDVVSLRSDICGNVDVLMVRPRLSTTKPLKFLKPVGKCPADVIWMRNGHEVVRVSPSLFPILFCRAGSTIMQSNDPEVAGSIPPSPATLRRFLGRVDVLENLFDWLQNSDQPRTFLHGKGGSGKTTIAHEFAKLLKEHGSSVCINGGNAPEVVVFLSAKQREFSPISGLTQEIVEPDFSSEEELHQKILQLGGWTSDIESLLRLSRDELRTEIKEFLDLTSALIVVDDVDTLTTKGVDPGFEFLFAALCRSKRQSKVLYTLRNVPAQALAGAIEVPGLPAGEFETFVIECCRQFGVKEPNKEFRDGVLSTLSERRPLIIETIIALTRTAGSYSTAAQLFENNVGDNARDYVFMREWDALSPSPLSRLLLAALAELDQPSSFSDIQAVLQAEHSRVLDAIAAVRDMFLLVNSAGAETLYSLASLTRSFVMSKKDNLQKWGLLSARVKAFKRTVFHASPEVARIVLSVERSAYSKNATSLGEVWREVNDTRLRPATTEDPIFKSARGYVGVLQQPPRLTDAREDFTYVFGTRYEPEFKYLKAWLFAERDSNADDGYVDKICQFVLNGKRYTEREKLIALALLATSTYNRARQRMFLEPLQARKELVTSVGLHLKVFRQNCLNGDERADQSEHYARNSAYQIINMASKGGLLIDIADDLISISATPGAFLDPLEGPILEFLKIISRTPMRNEAGNRLKNKLRAFREALGVREKWLNMEIYRRLELDLQKSETALSAKMMEGRSA